MIVQTRELDTQAARLAQALRAHALHEPQTLDAPLFGIVGERGSGKTTLLNHFAQRITDEQEFEILPILRPELLGATDSLLVTVANSLVHDLMLNAESVPESVQAAAQRALRSTIFANISSISTMMESSLSLGQFVADSSSVLMRAAEMRSDLQRLIDDYLAATERLGIIVPIDDLDMVPGQLNKLLADVRFLAELRGLIPIICVSWDDLRANLHAEIGASFPTVARESLNRLVEQQVMKTLRPDRVFEPLQLPRGELLHFTPIGEERDLGHLLVDLTQLMDRDESSGLTKWLRERIVSLGAVALNFGWLPGTYRGLENLYYHAAALERALSGKHAAVEVGHRTRSFLSSLAQSLDGTGWQMELESVRVAEERPVIQASVDWPRYRLGVSASSTWRRAVSSSGTRVSLRSVGQVFMTERNSSTGGEDTSRRAGASEVSTALILQSFMSADIFDRPRPGGPLALGEAECDFLQVVTVAGLPTSDRVLLLPPSTGIVQTGRWMASWNAMVDRCDTAVRPEGALTFANLLGFMCQSVVQIWLKGDDVDPEWNSSTQLADILGKTAEEYVKAALATQAESDWSTDASKAFCEWFEMLLPQAFHDALLSPGELSDALVTWQAAISSTPMGEQGVRRLREVFKGALEAKGARPGLTRDRIWLYGYRDLFRNLGGDLNSLAADFGKEYLERRGRGSKGRGPMDETFAVTDRSERYVFASRVTDQGRAEEADIRRLLDQLVQP